MLELCLAHYVRRKDLAYPTQALDPRPSLSSLVNCRGAQIENGDGKSSS
jgi:hypothetical protein